MDVNHQAGKNFIWLTTAQAVVRVLGLAFYLFLSYKLLDRGLGQYNFISSFVPFWFIFIDFGAGDFLYREWAKAKDPQEKVERDFNILLTARFFIALAIFLVFVVVNYFINRAVLVPMMMFYGSMFVAMILHLYDLYLQSHNLFRYPAIRQIIEKGITVVAGTLLLMLHTSVTFVFLAIMISQIISFFYYYGRTVKFSIGFVFDWQRARELFLKGLPFMFIGLFASLYARIDMVMLRYMKGFEVVGWYGASYKFLDISTLFSVILASSIFPLLASLYSSKQQAAFTSLLLRALRIVFSVGVLIALFFVLFAPLLIYGFFADSFSPSILALRILMIAQVLMFTSILFNNVLIIQDNERKGLYIIVIGACLNIGLNFVLIPRFSLYGAAWATVVAELANVFLLQYFVRWEKDAMLIAKMVGVVAANGLALSAYKYFGIMNSWPWGAALLLTNAAILFIIKLLYVSDITMFLKPIQSKLLPLLSYFGGTGRSDPS